MQIIQVKSAGNQSQARAVQKFTILLGCFIPVIVLGHLNLVAESFWLNIKKKKSDDFASFETFPFGILITKTCYLLILKMLFQTSI